MSRPARRQTALSLLLGLLVLGPAAAAMSAGAEEHAAAAARGTFLLVYPPPLEAAALPWAAYRRDEGWTVHAERLAPAPAEPQRARVRDAIVRRHAAAGDGPFAVLLLGDADAIPTWSFAQDDPMLASGPDPRSRRFVSDHPYQLIDGDEIPDLALGRVPARSVAEARAVLDKVRRYERSAPLGPWRRRIHYAAGEGRYGAVDLVLEHMFRNMVRRLVPEKYDLTMTYAKATSVYCPPPDHLTETILARLDEGAILFNYVGHGGPRGLDFLHAGGRWLPILGAGDLGGLKGGSGRLPIALLTCCSTGWFDLEDGEHSLAEAMLFQPGGPVAVIAGSRPTHPYANTILQKDVTRLLLVERVETVGELDRRADRSMLRIDALDREIDRLARPLAATGSWASSLADLRRMHVRLYNLLGDPALRIAHPASEVRGPEVTEGRVRGEVPGMVRGTATLTFECDQLSMTRPGAIRPVLDGDDPDFAAKAARNYPIANEQVFARVEAEVVDGGFSAELPADLPEEAILVKVYAAGRDASGRAFDAFGGTRFR